MAEPFRVDPTVLADAVARMAEFGRHVEELVAEIESLVTRLHVTWTGEGAAAHAEAQRHWAAGEAMMRQALAQLTAAGQSAHANYTGAMATNLVCGRELMAPLAVDPAALDSAGGAVVAAGAGLGAVISSLTAALAGCAGMAGDDPAGAVFGRSYDGSAAALVQAMSVARNGLCNLGDGVRMSAHNYSLAEAMSDVAGRAAPLPAPPPSGCVGVGAPPSAVGGGGGAPKGWGWVAPYIGMIWPNGDSTKLRAAAVAWRSAGTQFALTEIQSTAGPMGVIRAQQLPEAGLIESAFADAYASTTAVVGQCHQLAAQLDAYAARIDAVHAAVLDLLARICDPLTGIKEVWEFLTDQDEDEIQRIAHDIAVVVDQFSGEVDALAAEITAVVSHAEAVITAMADHAGKQWDRFLHSNPVGVVIDGTGQQLKGFGEEAFGMAKDSWDLGPLRAR